MISLSVEVKNIDVGTLLAFLFFSFSDGVLCFHPIFCVCFFGVGPSASMRVHIWIVGNLSYRLS